PPESEPVAAEMRRDHPHPDGPLSSAGAPITADPRPMPLALPVLKQREDRDAQHRDDPVDQRQNQIGRIAPPPCKTCHNFAHGHGEQRLKQGRNPERPGNRPRRDPAFKHLTPMPERGSRQSKAQPHRCPDEDRPHPN
ncbi:MAG: hypothetical protein ACK55I_25440, partial [bacterium]